MQRIFLGLLKCGPAMRNRLLTWTGKCLSANVARGKLWSVQVRKSFVLFLLVWWLDVVLSGYWSTDIDNIMPPLMFFIKTTLFICYFVLAPAIENIFMESFFLFVTLCSFNYANCCFRLEKSVLQHWTACPTASCWTWVQCYCNFVCHSVPPQMTLNYLK